MENDNIMLDVDSENKTINIKIINEENIIGILTDIITKKNIMIEKIYKLLELLNIEKIENIDKKVISFDLQSDLIIPFSEVYNAGEQFLILAGLNNVGLKFN